MTFTVRKWLFDDDTQLQIMLARTELRLWWAVDGRRYGARNFVWWALKTQSRWNDYVMQFEEEQHNG